MSKKTVLITSSSTGFGHATAELFADKGWNVVAIMRDISAAGDLAKRDNVLVSLLDGTDPASIDQTIRAYMGESRPGAARPLGELFKFMTAGRLKVEVTKYLWPTRPVHTLFEERKTTGKLVLIP
jgi:NAD(P)-dependent dehydrogenase (short-subunit alcohol dehydrogenase family)